LAAGYVALAWVALNYDWDWGVAETSLRKAAFLEPGSVIVLSYRSYLFEALGRLDEAIALSERATVLDPLRTNAYLEDLLFYEGRYEEAKVAINRLRVGDWRVIYELHDDRLELWVLEVGARGGIY
jgi:mRNA-degrading endonuclease RelE of RelBE toxin-antitoxin system